MESSNSQDEVPATAFDRERNMVCGQVFVQNVAVTAAVSSSPNRKSLHNAILHDQNSVLDETAQKRDFNGGTRATQVGLSPSGGLLPVPGQGHLNDLTCQARLGLSTVRTVRTSLETQGQAPNGVVTACAPVVSSACTAKVGLTSHAKLAATASRIRQIVSPLRNKRLKGNHIRTESDLARSKISTFKDQSSSTNADGSTNGGVYYQNSSMCTGPAEAIEPATARLQLLHAEFVQEVTNLCGLDNSKGRGTTWECRFNKLLATFGHSLKLVVKECSLQCKEAQVRLASNAKFARNGDAKMSGLQTTQTNVKGVLVAMRKNLCETDVQVLHIPVARSNAEVGSQAVHTPTTGLKAEIDQQVPHTPEIRLNAHVHKRVVRTPVAKAKPISTTYNDLTRLLGLPKGTKRKASAVNVACGGPVTPVGANAQSKLLRRLAAVLARMPVWKRREAIQNQVPEPLRLLLFQWMLSKRGTMTGKLPSRLCTRGTEEKRVPTSRSLCRQITRGGRVGFRPIMHIGNHFYVQAAFSYDLVSAAAALGALVAIRAASQVGMSWQVGVGKFPDTAKWAVSWVQTSCEPAQGWKFYFKTRLRSDCGPVSTPQRQDADIALQEWEQAYCEHSGRWQIRQWNRCLKRRQAVGFVQASKKKVMPG